MNHFTVLNLTILKDEQANLFYSQNLLFYACCFIKNHTT